MLAEPDPLRLEFLRRRTRLALDYLERLSADCTWAHRASGLRGMLWRVLETPDEAWDLNFELSLQKQLEMAFWMLRKAAMEISDPDTHIKKQV